MNGGRPAATGLVARFKEQPPLNAALAAAFIAVAVLALVAVGPASESSGQGTRTTTVAPGCSAVPPADGTVVMLSGEVGETVSGTGTSKASTASTSASSSSTSSGTALGGAGSSTKAGATGSGGGSSTGTSSSSGSFAVLSDLEALQLGVELSESEIGSVKAGQIAIGRKVAAHVADVAQTPASTSGAVKYDVTFQLDQNVPGLKDGMRGLPAGGRPAFNRAAARTALTKYSACMRENGVNLPAPNTSGNGPVFNTKGIDTSSSSSTGWRAS